jgi:3-isopropylmalate/(R)-2-methylmalate dehydratase small subunit
VRSARRDEPRCSAGGAPVIRIEGRARVVGDDINTDYIITSTRKRETIDEQVLKQYLLETIDPAFAASVREGDLIVAGKNFGCGSAMEIAATVILAAGIKCVLAKSFSRTFFRNAINNGLIPVQCDTSRFEEGDALTVTLDGATLTVENQSKNYSVDGLPIPDMMLTILEGGGLVEYLRVHKQLPHVHR